MLRDFDASLRVELWQCKIGRDNVWVRFESNRIPETNEHGTESNARIR